MSPDDFTLYHLFVEPAIRDLDVLIPTFFMWFAVQFASSFVMWRVSASFRRLDAEKQRDFAIRCVSIVNGVISINTALAFVRGEMRGGPALYHPLDGYRFFRASIVAYFMWDLVVCFVYKWSNAFKMHAIASLTGTYLLMFPFADTYGTFFTGVFELSNSFIHLAEMFKALDEAWPEEKRVFGLVAAISKYTFAVLFFLIRVVGGTYVTYHWFHEVVALISSGKYHSLECVVTICVIILTIMALQYYWFTLILAAVFGKGQTPLSEEPARATTTKELARGSGVASPQNASNRRRAAAPKDE